MVVLISGSSVLRQVTSTVEAVVVLPPWTTPGVAVSAEGCITEIILVLPSSGVPLCLSQYSIQEISSYSLASDLS